MNSLNAERAISARSVLPIPALLVIVMSVHSSVAKAQDKPPGTDAKAKVELTTDPSPAQKGSNTIRVKLTDPAGKPIAGADVHVWQSSPAGLYENQDPSQAEMNLRGIFTTQPDGSFSFRSVKPAGYPVLPSS